MLFSRSFAAVASTAALALGLGCSAASSPLDSVEEMKVTKSCLETECSAERRRSTSACSDCESACRSASYRCDSNTACETSCSRVTCTDSATSTCASTGFKAILPATPNAELGAACQRFRARTIACGGEALAASLCTVFAKTERSERATTYDCLANQPCDVAPEAIAAACEPLPTTFGDELCAPIQGCDWSCNEALQRRLNSEGGWLRNDVQEAAFACRIEASCRDAKDCLVAWRRAVAP